MTNDPILDELRATREKMLAAAGGTTAGLVAMLQKEERQSGRKVLDSKLLPQNRQQCSANGTTTLGGPALEHPVTQAGER